MDEEVECGLKNIDYMSEVMVRDKAVVGTSACNQEADELI